jgi:hypothetical protein
MRNVTGCALMLALLFSSLWCSSATALTTVTVFDVTNTQAIINVITDQPGNCTYQLSEAQDLSVPVNDVNVALFPGSNSDARATSVVLEAERVFVTGARLADQGVDGKWYSRALAANTAHYGAVTCGTDTPIPFSFTTRNIATGNTDVDPLPFDSRALGNYAIPTFDFTDLTKFYIDPQTGFRFKLATGPGQDAHKFTVMTDASGNGNILHAASGTNWTSPTNGLALDSSNAVYTASAQDVLTMRLPGQCGLACGGDNWQGSINGSGTGSRGVDSYQLALTGNGNGSTIQVDVALSWNGVAQGSEWHTFTLPASTGTVTYPTVMNGAGLAAWQGPNYPLIPGMYMHAVQQQAPVNTAGTVVTWAGSAPYNAYFSLDARILTAGSKITIVATEYTIASVDSATQLTLTTSAGTQTAVTAYWANLSLMVRKHTASAGTVNIDGFTITTGYSETFMNGRAGFQQQCSHLTSTDTNGKVGRFCIFSTSAGGGAVYWITDELDSRFISRAFVHASPGSGVDDWNAMEYPSVSIFDATDPNSWWLTSTLKTGNHVTLLKATYHPEALGSPCDVVTGNYQTLPLDTTYNSDSGSGDNCHIVVTELTTPSTGLDLYTTINAVQPIIYSGKFGEPGLAFVQGGYAVLNINAFQQDSESWFVTINLSTGAVKGVYSSYMNQGKGSCRGCVVHGSSNSGPTSDWYALAFNDYAYSGDLYQVTVQTALSTTPAMSISACQALVTDTAVAWMIPYSDGCDTVTLAGSDNIPCGPAPRTWEQANAPGCTWHATPWKQWQAGVVKIGDIVYDLNVGFDEKTVFGKNTSGTTWIVLRRVVLPQGPSMVPRTDIVQQSHAANWPAMIECSYLSAAFIQLSTETDGSGMLWDRRFIGFNHNVFRDGGPNGGIISFEYYNGIGGGISERIGAFPGAVNQPETNRVFRSPSFSGKAGTDYVQSHPGWDGVNPWFTDMSPFAPGPGGAFSLWNQPGVVAAASGAPLYKIPAANAVIPPDKRRRAIVAWSGMYNFKDVSGGTITNSASDNFKYCSIDYAGATCGQPGEALGDLFINIPQATIDGSTGGAYDLNRVNVTTLSQEPLAVLQYEFDHLGSHNVEKLGRWERRITTGFARYNGQDTYSNAKMIWNSNILLFNCGTPNLQRAADLCIGNMPPPDTSESVTRYDFIPMPVNLSVGPAFAEVQFGYAENGDPSQFFCTTRQEACNTSSPAGTPFNWEGETRTLTNCSSGCAIYVPALPEHVLYYTVRRSDDGVNWSNGPMQVAPN